MRRRLLLAGAALLSGCATDAFVAAPGAPVPAPRVRVGDRWTYERVNLYNGLVTAVLTMRVAEVSPRLRVEVTGQDGTRYPDEAYADPWRVIQEPQYDQTQWFRDPVSLLPSRLEAGSRHRIHTTYRVQGIDRDFFWSDWLDAVGWQRVRTPAGEFDALRVERRIAFVHSDPFRDRPTREDTLWYAPAVNRWVLREWTGRYWGRSWPPPLLREDWVGLRLVGYSPADG
jgi:hypothetical protein